MNIAKLMAMLQFGGKRTPVLTVSKGINFLRANEGKHFKSDQGGGSSKVCYIFSLFSPPPGTPIGFPLLKAKTMSVIGFIDCFFLK